MYRHGLAFIFSSSEMFSIRRLSLILSNCLYVQHKSAFFPVTGTSAVSLKQQSVPNQPCNLITQALFKQISTLPYGRSVYELLAEENNPAVIPASAEA